MKLFKLQLILHHLMGHHMSCLQLHPHPPPPPATIKLVRSDGLVTIYHRPVHVSDLLARFPKHLVCRSDALYIGQKIPPLSDHDQLQLGHCYFLLPSHCFQSALSFVSIASFVGSNAQPSPSLFNNVQPFDIQKGPSGALRIRVSDDFIERLMEKGQIKGNGADISTAGDVNNNKDAAGQMLGRVCSTPQLQRDYTMLVESRHHCWKPKLETISETDKKKKSKRRNISSLGMQKRKKSQLLRSSELPVQLSNCTNKPKNHHIKIKSSRKTKGMT